jgi:hypothetical protein
VDPFDQEAQAEAAASCTRGAPMRGHVLERHLQRFRRSMRQAELDGEDVDELRSEYSNNPTDDEMSVPRGTQQRDR